MRLYHFKEGQNGELFWFSRQADERTYLQILNKDCTDVETHEINNKSILGERIGAPRFVVHLAQLTEGHRALAFWGDDSGWKNLHYYHIESGKIILTFTGLHPWINPKHVVTKASKTNNKHIQFILDISTADAMQREKKAHRWWVSEQFNIDDLLAQDKPKVVDYVHISVRDMQRENKLVHESLLEGSKIQCYHFERCGTSQQGT